MPVWGSSEILRNMTEDDDDDKTSESLFWANLLGTCRFLGDMSLGEQIARSLIDMEPRWEDVARVKEMMKDRKVGRMPGCNLIDLKEIVHKLKVGDNLREGMEVSMMMGEIAQKLSFSSKQPSLNNPETGI
jgi:hypothetical protein